MRPLYEKFAYIVKTVPPSWKNHPPTGPTFDVQNVRDIHSVDNNERLFVIKIETIKGVFA